MPTKKLKVAILGSGNIGTDLLLKVRRSPYLECNLFIGRNMDSLGINLARKIGVNVSDQGILAVEKDPACCELLFDATSAKDHVKHWPVLQKMGKYVIDMTPSMTGHMIVPAINRQEAREFRNVNMISCGGQASIPIAHQLMCVAPEIQYIEIVSSIASRSAGPGTRLNIDEYIENTEAGLRSFTGCQNTKAILILNPAIPDVDMQTTVSVKIRNPDLPKMRQAIADLEKKIQQHVPGYKVIVPPVYENGRVVVIVKVRGVGDYLPAFAGNLDIINCVAVSVAEDFAKESLAVKESVL